MGLTSAVLISLQTGALVFLFPLYLVNQRHLEPSAVGVLVSLTVLGRLASPSSPCRRRTGHEGGGI